MRFDLGFKLGCDDFDAVYWPELKLEYYQDDLFHANTPESPDNVFHDRSVVQHYREPLWEALRNEFR